MPRRDDTTDPGQWPSPLTRRPRCRIFPVRFDSRATRAGSVSSGRSARPDDEISDRSMMMTRSPLLLAAGILGLIAAGCAPAAEPATSPSPGSGAPLVALPD